ncbi:MAG: hypothetical protein BV457_01605 [Thermoplasmata archaeon M9B1D]|nr:MAG: hypothetical protein BV457_01605 [Thermoplasmata archaeon M9B1D]
MKEQNEEVKKYGEVPPVKGKTSNIAEDIRLIIAEWLADKHIRYKTEYKTSGVAHAVSLFQTIAERHNIKCMTDYLKNYRIDNLSVDRQSSKELVEILKERVADINKEEGLDKISKFLE